MNLIAKIILWGGLALVAILSLFGCERIDAGHVGVKVNMYGDGKGVDDITEVTGWVFYNPLSTKIVEFPTYVQHIEYTRKVDEYGEVTSDESFVINSKDGSEFHVSPILNYSVKRDKVPYIFNKYRVELALVEQGFLKTAVYDAFRIVANSYTADELIGNREQFEIKVRQVLQKQLEPEGFMLSQFTSNLLYPETFKNAINAKNNSVQLALKAENDVKTAEAEAKIKVAKAEGEARAMLIRAEAEAESYRKKASSLTPTMKEVLWIEAWKATGGKVPQFISGPGSDKFILNTK
jgi:regulator of protease activity HflC (stomatin/prohibitin superfamily)